MTQVITFTETIKFRDDLVNELGVNLIVGLVQESIDKGLVKEETGTDASRNSLQIATLLETLEIHKIDGAMGGAEGMRKKLERKRGFFHTEMNLVNGIQKSKCQNYGIYLMEEKTMENTLEFFRYQTGQKWMSGNI